MITEIFVEGQQLDVSADISSLITFAIDDVKDFSSRQTTFSKTVVLPGTARNNTIFGNIFETGVSNVYNPGSPNIGINFNPSVSAKCIIYQDNLQTFKGTLRLMELNLDKGRVEYSVALNGELTNLSAILSTNLLEDLDFSEYDQNFTKENIVSSWDNTPGSGIYYPLIDYGTYSFNKHDWDIRTFRPSLYVKEYIDKIFAQAGFTYSSDLFNTDRFKRLIIPYNKKIFQGLTSQEFSASRSDPSQFLWAGSTAYTLPVTFGTFIGTLFTPSEGNSKFTYAGADPLTATFNFGGFGTMLRKTIPFHMEVWLNGVVIPGSRVDYTANGNTSPGIYSYNFTFNYTISTGEYLQLIIGSNAMSGADTDYATVTQAALGANSTSPVLAPIGINGFFSASQCIPNNIRQVDFLKSIVQLFNLYITEDQFDENLMHIEPFINFYSGSSSDTVDWTYKLDRNSSIKVSPMSEVTSKIYNFNFSDDSDYWNDLYKKRYNQGYGSNVFDSQFEFADQTTDMTIIFASTPLVGYDGEDKVYPTIFKRTGAVSGVGEETVDSVIRIMQSKKVMGVSPWAIKDGATTLNTLTAYGYAGHFDDPDVPMNDLNFGALNELFFVLLSGDLSKTQFNVYWSSYMAEITDKDSKLLTAKFYLTPRDIFELNFARYVYVDGSLFRLNKITDYNASMPSTCTVELLKVINTTYKYVTYPPVVGTFHWLSDVGVYFIDSDTSKLLFQ